MHEMRAIAFVTHPIDGGMAGNLNLKRMHIHSISAEDGTVRINIDHMETVTTNTKTLVSFALAALTTFAVTGSIAKAGPAEQPNYTFEKCYGVAKAGLNDRQSFMCWNFNV